MVKTYFLQGARGGPVKIGRGTIPERRRRECQTGNPEALVLLGEIDGDIEKELHLRFKHLRMVGEWFRLELELRRYLDGVGIQCGPSIAHRDKLSIVANVHDSDAMKSAANLADGDWYESDEAWCLMDRLGALFRHDPENCNVPIGESEEPDPFNEFDCAGCAVDAAVVAFDLVEKDEVIGFAVDLEREDHIVVVFNRGRFGKSVGSMLDHFYQAWDIFDQLGLTLKMVSYSPRGGARLESFI